MEFVEISPFYAGTSILKASIFNQFRIFERRNTIATRNLFLLQTIFSMSVILTKTPLDTGALMVNNMGWTKGSNLAPSAPDLTWINLLFCCKLLTNCQFEPKFTWYKRGQPFFNPCLLAVKQFCMPNINVLALCQHGDHDQCQLSTGNWSCNCHYFAFSSHTISGKGALGD